MTYVYICKACLAEEHANCEKGNFLTQEQIEAGVCGGGHCLCDTNNHSDERNKWIQSVWDRCSAN